MLTAFIYVKGTDPLQLSYKKNIIHIKTKLSCSIKATIHVHTFEFKAITS